MNIQEGLTFDDVLLLPGYTDFMPSEADISTFLTKTIKLSLPLVSAAMDRVTESAMAIGLAKAGGIGIIHRNLSIKEQAMQVGKVKEHAFSLNAWPLASCDRKGRLRVGGAVGTDEDTLARVKALIYEGVDVVVVDTAHGYTKRVIEMVRTLRRAFLHLEIIAGNVATGEGTKALIEAGANAVKVGIGPASICTTRIVSGVGVPQLTAIMESVKAAKSSGIPIIADGGIRFSGDIVKALAAGASTVMLGSLFAGTDESPGAVITWEKNQYKTYRGMGSLDAMRQRQGSRNRYFQDDEKTLAKLVPEGIEGLVPYKGSLFPVIDQLVGGLKVGMGYTGCKTLAKLHAKTRFVRISFAGMRESHVHNVTNIKDAPNYRIS